mmetsp:Transcript_24757/g.35663  ORF Transcript_24757/g.35663 Transcript_24757/m.35663 type:complete len:333 (-) Transcript_24757:259-1257(-)
MAVDERMSVFDVIAAHQTTDGCDSTCVSWKIGFLFIILVGALAGGLAPLLFTGKSLRTRTISQALLLCSGGVLLAIAIVHMMEDAIENLLPFQEAYWSDYPFAFTMLMIGFLLDHLIESVGGYYFGKYLEKRTARVNGGDGKEYMENSAPEDHDKLEEGLAESELSIGEQKKKSKSEEAYFLIAASAGYFGLSVHSVLAGLTLGLGDWETALSMFVAIISHKIFAAFAVASNLLKAKPAWWIYFTVITCFALTTPVSIGIGMGIAGIVGDIAKGTLLALAAGMLLYVGTVHTLEHAMKDNLLSPIWAYLSYLSGAALMVCVIAIVTFTIGGG